MPTADAGPCFPAELLEQLKEQLPQALFATLSDRVATYAEQLGAASKLDTTRSELQYARLKIQVLEEHLRLRRIAKYGPGSEKLSDLQLQLLEEEPGVSRQEVAAESEREPLSAAGDDEKKRKRRPHPGRQTLPADLPRDRGQVTGEGWSAQLKTFIPHNGASFSLLFGHHFSRYMRVTSLRHNLYS